MIVQNLKYHLDLQKVDHCLIIDNGSTDSTLKKIEQLSDPRIKVVHFPAKMGYRQDVMYTLGAKILHEDFNCDWILPTDADEFWISETVNSLPEILSHIPDQVDYLKVLAFHFRESVKDDPTQTDFLQKLHYAMPSKEFKVVIRGRTFPRIDAINFGGHSLRPNENERLAYLELNSRDLVRNHYNHISRADTIRRILNQVEGFLLLGNADWLDIKAKKGVYGAHVREQYYHIKNDTFGEFYEKNYMLHEQKLERGMKNGNIIYTDRIQRLLAKELAVM